MLKNILKLDGAQKLSKNEQKSINGGGPGLPNGSFCTGNRSCRSNKCEVQINGTAICVA